MKLIHVVPAISQEADGITHVVRNLCESLIASKIDVRLATLDWSPMSVYPNYLTRFPLGFGPRKLGNSPQMRRWLQAEVKSDAANIIHNHGMWMMPNVYAGNVCLNSSCRLMFSPHGSMSSWAFSINPIMKYVFWRIFQQPAARAAACFHATSESEFADIRRLGFKQPVCIIPCGVNMLPFQQGQVSERRQLLYLARIHPIKGVGNLLHAWQKVEHKFPDWDVVIAGPDIGGYLGEMQALSDKLQLKRIVFRGSLFGDDKLKAYRDASLYVLPSHSENFGLTVAEALAAGTPAIVTHGAPWAGLPEHGAGWWVEVGVEPLVRCFEQALSTSPERLGEMGKAGYEWMERDFSWERISSQFTVTYRWLIEGGEPPLWVRLD